MPHIVKPRLVTCAIVTVDAGIPAQVSAVTLNDGALIKIGDGRAARVYGDA
jgi:hypothetical protein